MKNKLNTIFKIIVIVFCSMWIIKEIVLPVSVGLIYSKSFMKLVYKCNTAMEADWYYSQSLDYEKKSNEIQMLDCHEYDKVRKLMLMVGLSEKYLSWLDLQALEIYQRPVKEFTEQHKFIER